MYVKLLSYCLLSVSLYFIHVLIHSFIHVVIHSLFQFCIL